MKPFQINEQIFILTIVMITIPSIIISIAIYYFSVQTMKEEYVDNSHLILNNLSFNIDQYLQGIEDGSLGIYLEHDFQKTLESWNNLSEEADPLTSIEAESELRRFIGSIDIAIPNVESVQVYANDQIFHSDFFSYQTFDSNITDDTYIYNRAIGAKGKRVLISTHPSPFSPQQTDVISIARTINKLGSKQAIGVVVINVRLDALHNILSLSETANRNFVIMDEDASIIYASDEEIMDDEMVLREENSLLAQALMNDSDSFYGLVNGVSSFISHATSDYSNWTVIQYIDKDDMTAQASHLRLIVQILIILSIITAILFMYILYKRVTKPVVELSDKVQSIREGNFALEMQQTSRKDEVGALYNGFNDMSQHLAQNIERSTILKTQQKVAHYSALKSQIHPHFLANALESIQMQAVINDEREIAEMIGLLGALFRKSIQSGKEVIPLEDELAHIRLYIKVQQLRFQDKIQYIEDVESRALSIGVLHFSLQPFIENAIIHGLEAQVANGTIFVEAKVLDEKLIIEVRDDGVGMDADQLAAVNKHLYETTNTLQAESIGMKNVHEQIQYYFGEAYGVTITSKADVGTQVTITLPADTLAGDNLQ